MSAYLNAMSWVEELEQINGLDLQWLQTLSIRKLRGIAQYINQNIERWFYKRNLGKSVGYFVKEDLAKVVNQYYVNKRLYTSVLRVFALFRYWTSFVRY